MKEIAKSLKESALSRIKNPIIGSFVFGWIFCNFKPFLLFLFNSNPDRIALIKAYEFSIKNDFFLPSAFVLIYIFIIPFAVIVYDLFNEGVIKKIRNNIQQNQLEWYFRRVKSTNKIKVESDEEVLKAAALKEINDWPIKKRQFSSEIITLKERYAESLSDLKIDCKQKIESNANYLKSVVTERDQLKADLELLSKQHVQSMKNSSRVSGDIDNNMIFLKELLEDELTAVESGTYQNIIKPEYVNLSKFYSDASRLIEQSRDSIDKFDMKNQVYSLPVFDDKISNEN